MADATTVANLQANLGLNTEEFSGGVDRAAGATNGLTSAILKADLVKGALSGVANFAKQVTGVVKQAVESYGEYEQLIGGVETLFGTGGMDITEYAESVGKGVSEVRDEYAQLKEAENLVISNAQNAWQTAGMGANEYMGMVTGFAASLKQSTKDSTEAARVADMAMQDISDNANKMGTDMGSIQQAYQGFAKQNYTMLDNLKLGYGGTKTEMQRLLKDAQKISGVKYDISNLSDVYEAIHVIQGELGITGTTAEEASTTIQGSAKAMKAAWSNMLTSMVTGGEYFDKSLDALVESVQTFVKNLAPAVQGALNGISSLIAGVAPIIADLLPGLVESILPGLIDAVTSVLDGVLAALPGLLTALNNVAPLVTDALVDFIPSLIAFFLDGIPSMVQAGITLLASLVSGLADNIETIVPQLTKAVVDMVDRLIGIIQTDGSNLASAALTLLQGLGNALVTAVPSILTQITQLIQDISTNISDAAEVEDFVTTAVNILTGIVDSLVSSLPTVLPQLTDAVTALVSKFADIAGSNTTSVINAAVAILEALATGLADSVETILPKLTEAVMDVIDAIIDVIINLDTATFLNACVSIVTALANGITDSVSKITERLPELITKIVDWLTNPDNLVGIVEAALSVFGALVTNIPAILLALADGLTGIITGIVDFFSEHGDDIMEGLKTGLSNAFSNFGANISSWWEESGKPTFQAIGEKFKNFFLHFEWGESIVNFVTGIGTAIKGAAEKAKDAFTGEDGFAGKIKTWLGELDLLEAAKGIVDKIKQGISGAWDSFKQWFKDLFSGLFDSIEVPTWLNPKNWFGGGEKDGQGQGQTTETDSETGETIDMPSNMLTLDYDNLQPIPQDVIDSYQLFAEAINMINSAISGGGGEAGEATEGMEGSLGAEAGDSAGAGLAAALSGLPGMFDAVLTAAQDLASFFTGGFLSAINTLITALCVISTDDEGNTDASGGNTLYNSLGAIFGVLGDILDYSQRIAAQWTGDFVSASEVLRGACGTAVGACETIADAAAAASSMFAEWASQIWAVIDGLNTLNGMDTDFGGGGGGTGVGGARASGGPVDRDTTYLVGEEGPELFTPRRSGYIIPNEDLRDKGGDRQEIRVEINGNIYGDAYLKDYVVRTLTGTIRKELKLAA